ncbi:hypothetical protein [Paraburkholderia sp. CI3]|uniref:hypothetical protein n=1 Tax=Paraburkholderia sp. CI3 TaxID=2991060 RepID=UPI003D239AD2
MASGISTTTRFTAIVTSVGVLGPVPAAHARAAFDAATPLTPPVRAALYAGFMSRVLAGDAAQATASLAPALRAALTTAAQASFAAGFAAALGVAALVAASAAVVWKLAGRAEVVRFKGAVSWGKKPSSARAGPPFTPFSDIVCAIPAAYRARAVFPELGATLRVHDALPQYTIRHQ